MKEFYRRHLPHWQPRNAIFFVTFRLKDSLPYEVIEALREEREREKYSLAPLTPSEQNYLEAGSYFLKWDANLDQAALGPHWLARPDIADIVKEALHYRDGTVFDLHAFCIMSNHVHAVLEPLSRAEGHSAPGSEYRSDLQKIMQSLKRHTARQANLLLDRQGAFWQDESYDHVIRDGNEYIRIVNYVLENAVNAGLVSEWDEWPWTYCKPVRRVVPPQADRSD